MRGDVSVDGNMKALSSFVSLWSRFKQFPDFKNKIINNLRRLSNSRDYFKVEEIKIKNRNRNVMTLMSTSQCQLEIIGDAINHLLTNERQDG